MKAASIIILAGGRSSRMGSDKGLVLLNGIPMIQHIINEAEKLELPIMIIANNKEYESFGYPVYSDLVTDKGPVSGIYTALNATQTKKNIILSCDAPFVEQQIMSYLLTNSEGFEAAVSSYDNKQYPLIGVYSKSSIGIFKKALDENHLRLREVIKELKMNIINFNEVDLRSNAQMFENVNTKMDIENLER